MKYAITLALALTFIGVVACGESSPPKQAQDNSGSAASSVGPLPGEENDVANPFPGQSTRAEELVSAEDMLLAPRVGDLDNMKEWRTIRILTVYSTGQYYFHKGQEKGFTKEWAVLLQKFINRRVGGVPGIS